MDAGQRKMRARLASDKWRRRQSTGPGAPTPPEILEAPWAGKPRTRLSFNRNLKGGGGKMLLPGGTQR